MFFYLSKIFWFFIQPLNLTIFLLLAGLIAAMIGRRRLAATGSVLAFLVLALSAWTSLGAMMLNPLEQRFARPPLPEKVDGIVVLGGGLEGVINLARGGYELNAGGDRMVSFAAIELADRASEEPVDRSVDADLLEALASLSPNQRAAFVLHALDGLDATEIGSVLRCAPATARVHIHRARTQLATVTREEAHDAR